jgi:hypothetical protein
MDVVAASQMRMTRSKTVASRSPAPNAEWLNPGIVARPRSSIVLWHVGLPAEWQ